jgi:hypothetical protein
MQRFAHLVVDREAVDTAMEHGTPVTALCGKVWVPSRDPDRFPACSSCVDVVRRAWTA